MTDEERESVQAAAKNLETAIECLRSVRGIAANGIIAVIEPLIERCERIIEENV